MCTLEVWASAIQTAIISTSPRNYFWFLALINLLSPHPQPQPQPQPYHHPSRMY